MRSQPATSQAIIFSQRTCLPASRHADRDVGVRATAARAITTASRSSFCQHLLPVGVVRGRRQASSWPASRPPWRSCGGVDVAERAHVGVGGIRLLAAGARPWPPTPMKPTFTGPPRTGPLTAAPAPRAARAGVPASAFRKLRRPRASCSGCQVHAASSTRGRARRAVRRAAGRGRRCGPVSEGEARPARPPPPQVLVHEAGTRPPCPAAAGRWSGIERDVEEREQHAGRPRHPASVKRPSISDSPDQRRGAAGDERRRSPAATASRPGHGRGRRRARSRARR